MATATASGGWDWGADEAPPAPVTFEEARTKALQASEDEPGAPHRCWWRRDAPGALSRFHQPQERGWWCATAERVSFDQVTLALRPEIRLIEARELPTPPTRAGRPG